ncbi:MAG: RT0821/Lpp0805 family surface protein [Magnetovibrio sp.]|nr:RT0821/Lpp0805 family surface protein [Magnetovibrio sp.]
MTFVKNAISVTLVGSLIMLGGCSTTQDQGQKETVGTIAGAVLGGIIGSKMGKGEGQLWATGAGAVLGGWLGKSIGRSLDEQDKAMMNRTSQASLEHTSTGSTSTWRNPDSGHSGSVTPTRTYQKSNGTYCREFEQVVNVDGEDHVATGTACRQADGSWRVVN